MMASCRARASGALPCATNSRPNFSSTAPKCGATRSASSKCLIASSVSPVSASNAPNPWCARASFGFNSNACPRKRTFDHRITSSCVYLDQSVKTRRSRNSCRLWHQTPGFVLAKSLSSILSVAL